MKKPEGVEKIVLGTVQLGLNYGVNNSIGQTSLIEAKGILEQIVKSNIGHIDTARAYGSSEEVIGSLTGGKAFQQVKIITKLDFPNNKSAFVNKEQVDRLVNLSIQKSISALNKSYLNVVLLHNAEHFRINDGLVWKRLIELKNKGLIHHLGVSVQSPNELKQAFVYQDVEYIQLPYNILDHRWTAVIKELENIKLSRNIVVHVRSIYLQGLFLSESPLKWITANCQDNHAVISWLKLKSHQFNRSSIPDLCLAYVRARTWIDGIVIGVESLKQLKNNISLFDTQVLTDKQLKDVEASRPILFENTLNPSKWKT
ncbi:MAG: aldo/keto reductase [Colwellia sp.]|nr:aldo/keto reductase [Colwellia sp.]